MKEWLRRLGRGTEPEAAAPEHPGPEPTEGASPGIAALFDGVQQGEGHAVLDLGPAVPSHLRIYGARARRIRFADLLSAAMSPGWPEALRSLPTQPAQPYDVILAWDLLDWLPPEGHASLVERLAEVSADNARLHLLIRASADSVPYPVRCTLQDEGRMRYEPTGRFRPPRSPVQSAEVERLLRPFRVTQAFTLKVGFREYVAARRPPSIRDL